jgi:hypothetical protein
LEPDQQIEYYDDERAADAKGEERTTPDAAPR